MISYSNSYNAVRPQPPTFNRIKVLSMMTILKNIVISGPDVDEIKLSDKDQAEKHKD